MTAASRPWLVLPEPLVPILRRALEDCSEEIVEVIRERVPAFADRSDGPFGVQVLLVAVREAQAQFLTEVCAHERPRPRQVFFNLGRGHVRADRDLTSLLAAYRHAAQVTWAHVARVARREQVEAELQERLADAVFSYLFDLAAQSALGFEYESSQAAGRRQVHRQHLVRMLLGDLPHDHAVYATAVAALGVEPPARLAVLLVAGEAAPILPRLPEAVWVAPVPEGFAGLVGDLAEADREAIERAFAATGAVGVLGPEVIREDAALSYRRAAALLRLDGDGSGLIRADDNLTAMLLGTAPDVAAALMARSLALLDPLAEPERRRLEETLVAWLDRQGGIDATAGDLGVHPQTVRYRMRRIRDLLGDELEDPRRRFELHLALLLRHSAVRSGSDNRRRSDCP